MSYCETDKVAPRASSLVPKLHLGTHLPAKLYFAEVASR
jgi:hypothetical protein